VFGGLRLDRREEGAHRRHGFQRVSGLELLIRPTGEAAVIDALDADLQGAFVKTGADRIRTAQLLAAEEAAERQILPLREIEGGAVLLARLERHDHGIARIAPDFGDLKRIKTCHLSVLPASRYVRCI
jgi:hypothetical protein